MNELTPWFSLFGPLLAAIVAVFGWFVGYRLNINKDQKNKRRELRIQYLIEAYRRLEATSHSAEPDQRKKFESAIADIQLFGSGRQIQLAHEIIESMASQGFASYNPLLELLRKELRQELGMSSDTDNIKIFRFSNK